MAERYITKPITSGEAGSSSISIGLSPPWANASYNVIPVCAGVLNIVGIDVTSKTANGFTFVTTGPVATGDVFEFRVADPTTAQGTHIGTQVLTSSSGTYTPTPGTKRVWLRMVGGGGGGGGAPATSSGNVCVGAGGSSGVYFEKWIDPATTGGAFHCGSGGAGGSGSGGTAPDGSNTDIIIEGTTYTAPKGKGGTNGTAGTANVIVLPVAPTPATGADCTTYGLGGSGFVVGTTSVGQWASGAGGSSPLGGGGAAVASNGAAGNAGQVGGGGGSGASNKTVVAFSGGAGGAGLIIIHEFA